MDKRVGTDVLGHEICMLSEAVAGAFDLDDDGVMEQPDDPRHPRLVGKLDFEPGQITLSGCGGSGY